MRNRPSLFSGVVVFDEVFDRENQPDTITVSNGQATYQTFASTPSLLKGRMDGSDNRSFQKALTATALIEGKAPVSQTGGVSQICVSVCQERASSWKR